MPAYIEVREWEHEPTCKTPDDCNPAEYPAHHVRVFIGPAILNPFQAVMNCLIEAHEPEVRAKHHGDGAYRCSYCAAIRNAKKTLKAINGRPL